MASFDYIFDGRAQPGSLLIQERARVLENGSGYLRLTPTNDDDVPLRQSTGRAIHAPRIMMKRGGAQVDFETTIKFFITSVDDSPGDGLTFFIAPINHPVPHGSAGGNFGIFNTSGPTHSVFAVEFDTSKNSWDPDYKHVGINIESSVSKAFMRVDEELIDQEVTAKIQYKATHKVISVQVTAGTKSFEFAYEHDLGTVLRPEVQVGLSASSARNVAIHDVLSWSFSSTSA